MQWACLVQIRFVRNPRALLSAYFRFDCPYQFGPDDLEGLHLLFQYQRSGKEKLFVFRIYRDSPAAALFECTYLRIVTVWGPTCKKLCDETCDNYLLQNVSDCPCQFAPAGLGALLWSGRMVIREHSEPVAFPCCSTFRLCKGR